MALGPDISYSHASKLYTKQQPDGTTLNGNTITTERVNDVGSVVQDYGIRTLNGNVLPALVGFTVATFGGAGTHQTQVTIQVEDNGGQALAGVFDLDLILSDNAAGNGITAATMLSFNLTTGTSLVQYSANKAYRVQTDATGKAVINFGITAAPQIYVYTAVAGIPLPAVGSVPPASYS